MPVEKRACVDCGSTTKKLSYPGPRDLGCHRGITKIRKAARKNKYQQRVYGITQDEKKAILDIQDGGCICAPWTDYDGSGKRELSTDHDHDTGIVRGVLCKHCNDLLGRIRDDPTYFRMMIRYLENPPALKVVGRRVVPGHNPGV